MPKLRSHSHDGAVQSKRRTRQQKANAAIEANRYELSASGRDRYSAPAFGEETKPRGLPPVGPERDALVEQIRAMKATGATHLAVSIELDMHACDVSKLCTEHGITSARKAQGGRRRTGAAA